jgi:hypothetical protein
MLSWAVAATTATAVVVAVVCSKLLRVATLGLLESPGLFFFLLLL